MKTKFLKNVLKSRRQKITTINLESYQLEILKTKNVNVSLLARSLIDDFLKKEFPGLYLEIKGLADNEQTKENDHE